MKTVLLALLFALTCGNTLSQVRSAPKVQVPVEEVKDSVHLSADMGRLIIQPSHNLFVTHIDMTYGAGKVVPGDKPGLGTAGAVKGIYMLTGALYADAGIGFTVMHSTPAGDAAGHRASLLQMSVGIGFTIGDDRAQIINGIDLLPSYYLEEPGSKEHRRFALGYAPELGFHIRIGSRLHLGMIGKVQLFQPIDKKELSSWPRYGFAGAGILMRYD